MKVATVLHIHPETSMIAEVRLLRMKIEIQKLLEDKRNDVSLPEIMTCEMGCVLKHEFMLQNYPGHLCKVYRRIRYLDEEE